MSVTIILLQSLAGATITPSEITILPGMINLFIVTTFL